MLDACTLIGDDDAVDLPVADDETFRWADLTDVRELLVAGGQRVDRGEFLAGEHVVDIGAAGESRSSSRAQSLG